MKLALCFGRTLAELDETLSVSEFYLWVAYDRISPIGYERSDIHSAQISAAVMASQGAKVSIKDMLLQFHKTEDECIADQTKSGHKFFNDIIKAQQDG